ncbi:MAG TPA: AraC family transcriptional regulator [Trebonia sp.]
MVAGGAGVAGGSRFRAWRPRVPGVAEVLHARMTDHVYPMHAHDSWTLLIVDDGMVRYDVHRHEHGALDQVITLLPPHVPHNGRAATESGFRKRVVYLDFGQLPERLIGRAADRPVLIDPVLRLRVGQLHEALGRPGDELEAESRLALITDRLRHNLQHYPAERPVAAAPGIAYRLRDLLDAAVPETVLLRDAAARLHAHPAHLVRAFSAEFGLSPHQYVTGRRVDLARGFLLGGMPASQVAAEAGFYDQAHLTRHFKNVLGTTPVRFAGSGR